MPPLICQFASSRSKPDRIRSWIDYLQRVAQEHPDEGAFQDMVESLLKRAETWLPESEPASI